MADFSINQRFIEYCQNKGFSQAQIKKKLSIRGKSQISNWFNLVEPIPMRQIVKATKIFKDLNANWLINGNGEMLNSANDPAFLQANEPNTNYNCPECLEKERTIHALKQALDAKDELLNMYRKDENLQK